MEFWNDNIIKGNVRYCLSGTTPNSFVCSDASGTGCCAHMTLNQEYICHTNWPSSSFWSLISRIYANFIVDYRIFSGDGSLEHGGNVNALLGSKRFKGVVMAVRLIFSRP